MEINRMNRGGGTGASQSAASAAAVAAMDKRWRDEEKKRRSAEVVKAVKSALAWIFLLIAALVLVWLFAGDSFLPEGCRYSTVSQRLKDWWNPPPPKPVTDPADSASAADRAKIKAFIAILEKTCMEIPQPGGASAKTDGIAWATGRNILQSIAAADNWYFKAAAKLEDMRKTNAEVESKLQENRGVAKGGRSARSYGRHDIARQENETERKLEESRRARQNAVKRAEQAVKTAASRWTGPESRRDAAAFADRLSRLARETATP